MMMPFIFHIPGIYSIFCKNFSVYSIKMQKFVSFHWYFTGYVKLYAFFAKIFYGFISGFSFCAILLIIVMYYQDNQVRNNHVVIDIKNLPNSDELNIESALRFISINRDIRNYYRDDPVSSLVSEIGRIKGQASPPISKTGGLSSLLEVEDGFLSIGSDVSSSPSFGKNTLLGTQRTPEKLAELSPEKPASAAKSKKLESAPRPPPRNPRNVANKELKKAPSSSGDRIPKLVASQIEKVLQDFQISPIKNGFRVVVPGADLFVGNSRNLGSNASSILNPIAQAAKLDDGFRLEIVGHTDGIKSAEQSLQLSLHRATLVKSLLSDMIRDESLHLRPSGKGKEEPIASNATLDGRQKNRRIEVIFLK